MKAQGSNGKQKKEKSGMEQKNWKKEFEQLKGVTALINDFNKIVN